MGKVSIIVPVYNMEKLLHRCVDSILSQTYTDFELFLIDDGSKDSSGAICDRYAESDNRIRVIHKENGGVSSARNVGLRYAKGDYILFCDSDDYVQPCWCECMLGLLENQAVDLGICAFRTVSADTKPDRCDAVFSGEAVKLFERNQIFELRKAQVIEYGCTKIFRKKILDEFSIRFNEKLLYGEDFIFVMEYIRSATGKFAYYEIPIYNYTIGNENSLTNKYIENKWDVIEYTYDQFDKTLECCGVDISSIPKADYYKSPIWFVIYSLNNTMSKQNKSSFLEKYKANAKILHSERCKAAFKNGSFDNYNPVYATILKTRCFLLIYLFDKAVDLKHRIFHKKTKNA